jgi:hypothetical protein
MDLNVVSALKSFVDECTPYGATVVAISKTKPSELILEAYNSGHRDFGENKVQELTTKYEALPKDIQWHMVGHLQTNKVKYIAPFVHLIHSVDSVKLLKEINKQGTKHNRTINVLIQVHIARESSKFGFSPEEVKALFEGEEIKTLDHVNVIGLMGMATFTEDHDVVKEEFQTLKKLFDQVTNYNKPENIDMQVLSMGMTGDYRIALECGATHIRIGTAIFGERNYAKK